jgi:hypothetical protein
LDAAKADRFPKTGDICVKIDRQTGWVRRN